MIRSVRRDDTLASFWFLTLVVALVGPLLAAGCIWIDKVNGAAGLLDFMVISPDSARTILGSIAGSLITIASLTVSLTIVTLQLLSNQYTPRAVRGFLRRRVSQVVSGSFVGVFVYCVFLLVAVREPGDENEPFVPSLGVTVGIGLALVDLALLVLFINSLANTIQVSTMTSELAEDTIRAVREVHRVTHPGAASTPAAERLVEVTAGSTGYTRRTSVPRWEEPGDPWSVEVLARPGDFVTSGQVVLRYGGPELSADQRARLGSVVLVGRERDLDQDPAFGIRQLVDIALRALSPGINDPTTAVTCLGYLRGIYEALVDVELPRVRVLAEAGRGVVLQHGFTFADYLEPLSEIGTYAASDPRVTRELARTFDSIRASCRQVGRTDREESATLLQERGLTVAGPGS